MAGYRTPLSRARGLGAAKHGVGHFIGQRVSAIALVVLVLWAVGSGLTLARFDYSATVTWLKSGPNTVLTILLLGAGFFHMNLGMRTVIEDYIHVTSSKAALLILNLFACWLGGVIGVLAVLKVAFGVGA
ncbi:MAG: succinate dehydrogenase, hydrophobic membrane anchor protein [Caulobacteraceae bacterium]|nr:succinate dehydrogenase, hydrophobic membrane anchor protein [Caulobacteraceae bacterium]